MRENEYPPLLLNGFKEIREGDLHQEFVQPFNHGYDHRGNLLNYFNMFLNEFKSLEISGEIWIDGSFATRAPDPSDVDIVIYLNSEQVAKLKDEKLAKFEKLFKNRKFIRNLYKVEVHYAQAGDELEYAEWEKIFGTYYDNVTPKGIFRLRYSN